MTTYVLEMRSTAQWSDIRYREYTTSAKKADLFQRVPKIQFTDSGHGIVPYVREHHGRREPRNMILQEHVVDSIKEMTKQKPALAALPAPAGVEDWQPIETAPKDMTEIIVLCGLKDVRLGWYFAPSSTSFGWRDQRNNPIKPTHWRPLPALPTILAKPAQEGQGS